MFPIKRYEQLIQVNTTNTMLKQIGLFLLAYVLLPLAVLLLFQMLSVHFHLTNDIAVKLLMAHIKLHILGM